jgi:hypothetical protein
MNETSNTTTELNLAHKDSQHHLILQIAITDKNKMLCIFAISLGFYQLL